MDILLIVVLLILTGFGLHGYLRGLVRVLFSLAAVFLTIGLATALTPGVVHFLQTQTPVHNIVKEKCTEYLQQAVDEEIRQKKDITVFGIKMPQDMQEIFAENAAGQADSLMKNVGVYEKVGDFVAGQIVQRLAWVLSFVIIVIALAVVVHFLDILAKLPVLKDINRLGGLAIGLFEGLIVVWIVLLAVVLCQGSEFGREMMDSIERNLFLKVLYENNLLEHLIMR